MNGCANAWLAVNLFLGDTMSNCLIYNIVKYFGKVVNSKELKLTKLLAESDISSHSGLTNSYWPFIIRLNITNCFRCQNGGNPANLEKKNGITSQQVIYKYLITYSVYIMTPHAHLWIWKRKIINSLINKICLVHYMTLAL